MSERNVTVHLSIFAKVEGDAPVQEIGQLFAHLTQVNPVTIADPPTRITPLRVELERAHEQGTA